ncbi:MAG: NnrU family protein [Amylibacter sp.]|nr:NnrU family protein [Amylibacter sp.]
MSLLLVLGVFLWIDAHWVKRLVPSVRAAMDRRMGAGPARGLIAGLVIVSLVMMVVGYRGSEIIPVYTPFSWAGHLNNLLMIFAVMCMGMGSSKGRMRTWFRHPMLTGVVVWAIAHLLVNGDVASIILFGGMGFWAFTSRIIINRSEGVWKKPEAGPVSSDIKLLVISAVVFVVIVGIHIWLGYNPFTKNYA